MATETLEENKSQVEAPAKDKEEEKNKEGEDLESKVPEKAYQVKGILEEAGDSQEKNGQEKGEESEEVKERRVEQEEEKEDTAENIEDKEHEEEDEAKEKPKAKAKGRRKASSKEDQSESKKLEKESEQDRSENKGAKDPATPASERPTRDRKTVERFSIPTPAKSGRSSAGKALLIEKGRGTQLKDIPNVAFKLSKRKADDNLQILHNILFGKKAKVHSLKRNIGQFSGYVWVENEEKQRAKVKEKIDKCVKEKLVDFCDVLNIQINKATVKKEELSAKLLEFLESPHATTDVLLADKDQKGQKRKRKATPSKSTGDLSVETPVKKQKQTSQVGKKLKQSPEAAAADEVEVADAKVNSQEDDFSMPNEESEHDENKSEEDEDDEEKKPNVHKSASKKTMKEGSKSGGTVSVKKTSSTKAVKSVEKTPKNSTSKQSVTDHESVSASKSKQSASKKQKTTKKNLEKEKATGKRTDKSSTKSSDKNPGKGKRGKKGKQEPSREEMHAVVVDILKEVDFNTATLSDILRQLGAHFGLDLMHRKAEVKDIITDVINNMSDEEDGEESEDAGDGDDADKDDDDA